VVEGQGDKDDERGDGGDEEEEEGERHVEVFVDVLAHDTQHQLSKRMA